MKISPFEKYELSWWNLQLTVRVYRYMEVVMAKATSTNLHRPDRFISTCNLHDSFHQFLISFLWVLHSTNHNFSLRYNGHIIEPWLFHYPKMLLISFWIETAEFFIFWKKVIKSGNEDFCVLKLHSSWVHLSSSAEPLN